ncbi:hypothetical protein RvY_09705-2 [Ramazzottius varieornatus]|uniref:Uncharacterized protein n=1 Tax=Ramazzottius varieornatus TaxID=947166 RepID=A0A1D1VAC8_RAMVA|nr:hypothetical protein RvY_09705-2 [Ramazzottius varieornatus]
MNVQNGDRHVRDLWILSRQTDADIEAELDALFAEPGMDSKDYSSADVRNGLVSEYMCGRLNGWMLGEAPSDSDAIWSYPDEQLQWLKSLLGSLQRKVAPDIIEVVDAISELRKTRARQ